MTASLRAEFHPLTIARVEPLTDDSVALTFDIPDDLRTRFDFRPGQSLTVKRGDERRSYSICAAAGTAPRIGVREVAGGAVSGWLVREVKAGDVLDVQTPTGSFSPDVEVAGNHVLIAAGSGVTPMISIAASLLAGNPDTTVTLLYGNRRAATVMFADEIADLKDRYPARLQLVHVLSREPQEVELFSGRLDAARLRDLLPVTVDVESVDHWWLCGPFGMVTDAVDVLRELGVDNKQIHRELFFVGEQPSEVHHIDAPPGPGADVTIVLDGRSTQVVVPGGTTMLDAAQRVRPDLPFACKGGVCGTCRAHVDEGEIIMIRNYALEDDEVAAGYVLTCQSLCSSETAVVDFDV